MQRRTANATRCCFLAEGEVVSVKQAKRFFRPLEQIGLVALEGLHPGNINLAQIEQLLPASVRATKAIPAPLANWMPIKLKPGA